MFVTPTEAMPASLLVVRLNRKRYSFPPLGYNLNYLLKIETCDETMRRHSSSSGIRTTENDISSTMGKSRFINKYWLFQVCTDIPTCPCASRPCEISGLQSNKSCDPARKEDKLHVCWEGGETCGHNCRCAYGYEEIVENGKSVCKGEYELGFLWAFELFRWLKNWDLCRDRLFQMWMNVRRLEISASGRGVWWRNCQFNGV